MVPPKTTFYYLTIKTLMKKILVLLIFNCIINLNCYSQYTNDWQLGLNLSPFYFTRFNPDYFPKKQDNKIPNGFGYGLTVEKNWNENWGVKTGIEITNQKEKYFVDEDSADNKKIIASFEYYQIPLTIQYYYEINEKTFITLNQGLQFSKLKYVKNELIGDFEKQTLTPDYFESIFFRNPALNYIIYEKQKAYNENLFGITGSIGIKRFFLDKFSYSTNLFYNYDFTNSEFFSTYNEPNKSVTNNFRIGLEIGIQYHFTIDKRFNKNPK